MNASFAWATATSTASALTFAARRGARLFRELVRQADIVAAN